MLHLVVGPARHGVVQHGLRVAGAGRGRLLHAPAVTAADWQVVGSRLIVQFTDRLFGRDAVSAAAAFARQVAGADRVTVVLHDLPQESDGAAWQRRRAGYAQVCERADVVVVSSAHEAGLLRDIAPDAAPVVIPLPVELDRGPAGADRPPGADRTIGVLGFLYPGKGIEEVIDAAAGLGATVVNVGTTALGHEDLAEELAERAARQGVPFRVTGWLSDAELTAACRSVDVPVAAHRHISASGSINAWIGAGRRPLVVRSAYASEQDARMPGALWLVSPGELPAALGRALARPGQTWLGPDVVLAPATQEVAELLEATAR